MAESGYNVQKSEALFCVLSDFFDLQGIIIPVNQEKNKNTV